MIEEITDELNDVAEGGLMIAIKKGEPWAIKYWLENRGQSRGFGARKMAFKDGDGVVTIPAVLVHSGRMTEEEWENHDWVAEGKAAEEAANPTIN